MVNLKFFLVTYDKLYRKVFSSLTPEEISLIYSYAVRGDIPKFIDKKIGNFKKLEVLTLDNTKINEIPTTICNLEKLKILSIRNTNIYDLPNCIIYLNNLTTLDISLTKIISFPIEILNAPKLDLIDAKGLKLKNYKEIKSICEKRNIRFHYDE